MGLTDFDTELNLYIQAEENQGFEDDFSEEDEDEENIDEARTSLDCQNPNLGQFNLTAVDFEAFDINGIPWNLQTN